MAHFCFASPDNTETDCSDFLDFRLDAPRRGVNFLFRLSFVYFGFSCGAASIFNRARICREAIAGKMIAHADGGPWPDMLVHNTMQG